MGGAKKRWIGLVLGAVVAAASGVVLAGLLSLLHPKLVFAGFPLGAALGGAVAGYFAHYWPIMQGATAGLVAGLVELVFLNRAGLLVLPDWTITGLVVITAVTGLLGARMAYTLRVVRGQGEPHEMTRDVRHEAQDTTPL